MKIESLEVNLFKASDIKDGDILLVRIDNEEKNKLTKEGVRNVYDQILNMIKRKDIGIYFFPKNLDIEVIKDHISNIENSKTEILNQETKNENESDN